MKYLCRAPHVAGEVFSPEKSCEERQNRGRTSSFPEEGSKESWFASFHNTSAEGQVNSPLGKFVLVPNEPKRAVLRHSL